MHCCICTVPDVIGKFLLIATSAAQLPVQKHNKDQEDKDEEQGTNNGANYHSSSVWSCKISMKNIKLFTLKFCFNILFQRNKSIKTVIPKQLIVILLLNPFPSRKSTVQSHLDWFELCLCTPEAKLWCYPITYGPHSVSACTWKWFMNFWFSWVNGLNLHITLAWLYKMLSNTSLLSHTNTCKVLGWYTWYTHEKLFQVN